MSDQPDEMNDRLQNFDPGASMMPLTGGEIRRRGDRLRRRRTALSVVAAAVAVAAIATPIAVLGNDGDQAVGPAEPDRTTQTPPTTEPEPTSTLLGADDLVPRPGRTAWTVSDDDFPVLGCQPIDAGGLEALGATLNEVRFGADVDLAGQPGASVEPGPPTARVGNAVLDFDTPKQASAAFNTLFDWLIRCDDLGDERQTTDEGVLEQGNVPVADGEALWLLFRVMDTDVCAWRDGCDGFSLERQGIARFGSRLVVLSLTDVGGPVDPVGLQEDMASTFPKAITRAGGEVTGEVTIDSANQGGEFDPGAFLDDVPLDDGLVAMEGDGGEKIGPGPDVASIEFAEGSCLSEVWPAPTALDKRAVSVSGPEYFEVREIAVFESSEAAATALEAVRQAVGRCPEVPSDIEGNDLTYTEVPDRLAENTITFSALFETGLTGNSLYSFGQFGNVVIGEQRIGEWSGSSANAAASDLLEAMLKVRNAVCDLTDCTQ